MRRFTLSTILAIVALGLISPAGEQVDHDAHGKHRQNALIAFAQAVSCWPSGLPLGAVSPAPQPIWCADPMEQDAPTFTQGANAWLDEFDHGASLAALGSGYRVFDSTSGSSLNQTRHWRHANHWMVDVNGVDQSPANGPYNIGGATMRPDRSFRFQGGKLVVEADAAAGIAEYDGGAWPEIVITTAPAPTAKRRDGIYNYDEFAGHWTVGCRLQDNRQPICAMFDNSTRGPGETGGDPLGRTGRVFEVSHFQNGASPWGSGATTKWGGDPSIAGLGSAWRVCRGTDPDTNCRDRFRWELDKDRLVMYVNGVRYMEHSGFPAAQQLPDALVSGDVYVYFGSWIFKADAETVRFHWDRLAVNPPTPPGPAPGFGTAPPPPGPAPGVSVGVPCAPRPRVAVSVAPSGAGRLQVTIVAGAGTLRQLRFGAVSNALIDVGSQNNVRGNVDVELLNRPSQITFFVRRATAGVATNVPLVAVDDCGDWSTFVGGGPNAF